MLLLRKVHDKERSTTKAVFMLFYANRIHAY